MYSIHALFVDQIYMSVRWMNNLSNFKTHSYNSNIILGDFNIPTNLLSQYSTRLTNILNF